MINSITRGWMVKSDKLASGKWKFSPIGKPFSVHTFAASVVVEVKNNLRSKSRGYILTTTTRLPNGSNIVVNGLICEVGIGNEGLSGLNDYLVKVIGTLNA